jgi:hypothetical protein
MNGNRNRYTTAPLYGMKRQKKAPPQNPNITVPRNPKPMNNHTFLQITLIIGLPLVFLLSLLFDAYAPLHWFFVAAAGACILYMWIAMAFVKNARATLTTVYVALIAISLVAIAIPAIQSPSGNNNASATQDLSAFTGQSNGSTLDLSGSQELAASVTPEPTESANAISPAQAQLDQFMNYWMEVNYKGMLSISLPSWVSSQENPEKSIFQIRANRTPLDYTIENASGSEADATRTITITVSIDKNNGKEPVNYRLQVLMLRVNNVWYVDPRSLNSAEIVQTVSENVQVETTIQPTASPSPTLILYYNDDGGKYYHINPNCPSIAVKYIPLTASFYYRDLNTTKYKNLLPCSSCHAPSR